MITCNDQHIYRNDKGEIFLSVTQNLVIAGLVDFSMVSPEDLAYAALRGQYVHEATNMYLYDDLDLDSLDVAYKMYIVGFLKFIEENNIEIISSEEIVYSDMLRTAGRYDFIAFSRSCPVLTIYDIKTAGVVPVTAGLQLSAYRSFYNANLGHEKDHVFNRTVLHLLPTGNYRLIRYRDNNDEYIFRCIARSNWYALTNGIIPIGAKNSENVYNLCKTIINGMK